MFLRFPDTPLLNPLYNWLFRYVNNNNNNHRDYSLLLPMYFPPFFLIYNYVHIACST